MSATLKPGVRTEADIVVMSVRCRIAVTRDEDGRITDLVPVRADAHRRRLIEAAARGIASGRPTEQLLLDAVTFADLWRELHQVALGGRPA